MSGLSSLGRVFAKGRCRSPSALARVAGRRPPSPQLHLPPPHSALRGISPPVLTFYINTDGFQDDFANRYLRQMLLAARFPWKLPRLNYPESASPEDMRVLRTRRFIQGGRAARVRGRGGPVFSADVSARGWASSR